MEMQYLVASEYLQYGLGAETSDALVTAASAMIDGFCRRPSLGVTGYVEHFRLGRRGNSVSLSNAPLTAAAGAVSPLVQVRVKLRRSQAALDWWPLAQVAGVLGLADAWSLLDVSAVDISMDGQLCFQPSMWGLPFDEVEVTYTAGFSEIPAAVKVACAQIVRNAQAMPALTVKSQKVDSMQMEYFAGVLVDAEVQRMLQPFVSERMG
jgi:hypothetical protein